MSVRTGMMERSKKSIPSGHPGMTRSFGAVKKKYTLRASQYDALLWSGQKKCIKKERKR